MPRELRLHAFGGPENLRIDEVPTAEPGAGEVRLRVQACSLNMDQFRFLGGDQYGAAQPPALPSRIGYEAAGVVEAVGEGVDQAWLGQSVAPIGPFDVTKYGCIGDQGIVPADRLSAYPKTLAPEQAAALWVPYLTAYGVVHAGGIREGDYVVIPAGASAVGLAAIQIARDLGALPIAVTRAPAKVDQLHELGAHEVIVSSEEDYVERVRAITGGRGARVTFDPIGGDFLAQATAAASRGGVVVEYGRLAGEAGGFPQMAVIGKGLTIRGFTVSEIVSDPELRARAAAYVLERVADGRFVPRVARTFPLEDFAAAFAYVKAGPELGRTVLVTS